ncbi:MAG: hypothetical protein JNL57_08480 [Bacteroidetes bacterium]|nr:hypothetical protein [Bacteroidota bacterium]
MNEILLPDESSSGNRRGFLKKLAAGLAILGIQTQDLEAATNAKHPAVKWFESIKGRHRVVFDVPHPNGIMPFAWPRVFLGSNESVGTPYSDCCVVVVLRHSAIAYAFDHPVWEKYQFGEIFKANDPNTDKPAIKNPFWKPEPGTFKIPGNDRIFIGINELQEDGVKFCFCEGALGVYSHVVAKKTGSTADAVKKDWMASLLPGIQPVPSGVWALGRAQEHRCSYIFAG